MKYPNDSFQPLFNKISPIIKHEKIYKAIHRQLMTKWFQTSVLLCIVGSITAIIYSSFEGNHSIFRHDNFIGCFSADKIKMSVRKYFCFNIPIDKNMAEGLFCRSPYHEEYIQTSASGNPEDLCH